jgi:hypothetical protein
MYIFRPNSGYHGSRKRPTRQARIASNARIDELLTSIEDTTTQRDVSQDLFIGTVDADFELLDSREIHIGDSTVLTIGLHGKTTCEQRKQAA